MGDLVRILRYDADLGEIDRRTSSRHSDIDPSLIRSVAETMEDVRERGDRAVLEATARWDSVELDSLLVEGDDLSQAMDELDPGITRALNKATERIEQVSKALLPPGQVLRQPEPGITVGERTRAIGSAGLWVPSRKGPLASTMLMLVVPARVAGVEEIVAATPPMPDGRPDPLTLAAAGIAGATKVLQGNGVALIGAMAFGTESVSRVDAIYGPGPPAIAVAMGYAGIFGIRTGPPMGPSECMVIADDSADPGEAAADLLNECEHGPDSSCVLVTDSETFAKEVSAALAESVRDLPEPRSGYVREALRERGMIVLVDDMDQAARFANHYAPEHLQIALGPDQVGTVLAEICNAGEVLLGQSTPFSAANYALGITAVLPTGGSAKAYSGITVRDFLKTTTIGGVERDALPGVCDIVSVLGEAEGFPAHVEACRRKMRGRDK